MNFFGCAMAMILATHLVTSVASASDEKDLLPWRRVALLANSHTQLEIEADKGKIYKIPNGTKSYFLQNEKGGPAVNICKAALHGDELFIRCDRKGGFRDGPKPRPWWWRYKARVQGDVVTITAVSQKDGPLESGEAVYNHFHSDLEDD